MFIFFGYVSSVFWLSDLDLTERHRLTTAFMKSLIVLVYSDMLLLPLCLFYSSLALRLI